jgi:hypothetical protein
MDFRNIWTLHMHDSAQTYAKRARLAVHLSGHSSLCKIEAAYWTVARYKMIDFTLTACHRWPLLYRACPNSYDGFRYGKTTSSSRCSCLVNVPSPSLAGFHDSQVLATTYRLTSLPFLRYGSGKAQYNALQAQRRIKLHFRLHSRPVS